tara:strand:- start:1199 stop:1708 length:510 start_codon:yes stop_codon:yes gene_type:complete
MNEYNKIEKKLNLSFKNLKLFESALNHSSLKNDNALIQSNEILEFMGDSVMYFIISEYIYINDKEQITSGDMSIIRSNIISNETFGMFAKKIHLDKHIKISKGQNKIGISELMLSNCFEALIGAIYADSGIENVKKFIFDNFRVEIHNLFSKRPIKNAKMLANESKQKS